MAKGLYDEYYTNGKIELARTGKNVSLKNHFTKDEIKQRNHEIASHYEESVSDISNLVAGIREKIKRCDPLLLLVTANDLSMVQMVNVLSDVQLENSNVGSLRLVENIQSVLVSTKLDNNKYDKETQDKIIMEILSDIEELYTKCQYFYFIWAASGSLKVVRMAFNLYCNSTPSVWDYEDAEEQVNECRQYTVEDIFCCAYAPYFWQAIQIRYPEYVVYNQKLHAMLGGID